MSFNKHNPSYLEWLHHPHLDPELKTLLHTATDQELASAFTTTQLEFGTAGIRGILGAGPGRFNIYTIRAVTIAYAQLLLSQHPHNLAQGVVIGHDNRHNSKKFAQEVASILTSFNIKAYLFKANAMKPTPVVSFAVKQLHALGGVVITASHNPKEYNGYKIYDQFGCQLQDEQTTIIAQKMHAIPNILSWTYQVQPNLIHYVQQAILDEYIKMIKGLEFFPNYPSKHNLKVVFSAVNGTGSEFTPVILRQAGYQVIEVAEHAFEDATFANVINPNPEFDPAWKIPLAYGVKHDADIIIMNDPDADRFGLAVKHNNQFIRLDGNQTGPLLIDWKLANLQKQHLMPSHPALYSSFVTSDLGDRIANEKYNVKIIKTLTGFKWMGREIIKEKTNGLNFVFAYEESYGYVLDASTLDKDGIQASIMVCEMAWWHQQNNATLIDYLDELFQQMGYYYTTTLNLNFTPEEKVSKITPIMHQFRHQPPTKIAKLKVVKIEDYLHGLFNMPGQDLLKFYLDDGSWFAIRPSGTEPKLKIYFVCVAQDLTTAQHKTESIIAELKHLMHI